MGDYALMLLFTPLVVDTLGTVIRRVWGGAHPFEPHCDFYYQRMARAGMAQKRVVGLHLVGVGLWGLLALLIR